MNQVSNNSMGENRMNDPAMPRQVRNMGQLERNHSMPPEQQIPPNMQQAQRIQPTQNEQSFGRGQNMQSFQGKNQTQNIQYPQGTQPNPAARLYSGEKSPAGFWIRLAAYLIDSMLTTLIIVMINVPIWILKLGMGDSFIFHNLLFHFDIFDILNYLIVTGYFIVMTYTTGRTVGKMLMKIRVQSIDGKELTLWQVTFREMIGKYLSHVFYIGYLMVGLAENKRGLHDCLADTQVIYEVK